MLDRLSPDGRRFLLKPSRLGFLNFSERDGDRRFERLRFPGIGGSLSVRTLFRIWRCHVDLPIPGGVPRLVALSVGHLVPAGQSVAAAHQEIMPEEDC